MPQTDRASRVNKMSHMQQMPNMNGIQKEMQMKQMQMPQIQIPQMQMPQMQMPQMQMQ